MTVSNELNVVRYHGTKTPITRFSIPFSFLDTRDLTVIRRTRTSLIKTLRIGPDYRVDTSGNRRDIVLIDTSLSEGETLLIHRNMIFTQEVDLVENEAFFAEVIENQFDRTTMYVQQLAERLDRSLTVPIISAKKNLSLPEPIADQVLAGRSDGKGWEHRPVTDLSAARLVIPVPVQQGGTGTTNRAQALATMGAPLSAIRSITDDYQHLETRSGETILADTSSGSLNITLPAADIAGSAHSILIKKIASNNIVTIRTTDDETIDGAVARQLLVKDAALQLHCDGSGWHCVTTYNEFRLPPGYFNGFRVMMANVDLQVANADLMISVLPGECRDDSDSGDIYLRDQITKHLNSIWTMGDQTGGLDSGTVAANSWYHLWVISDGVHTDLLFSTKLVHPTVPDGGYRYKRRIGSVKVNAAGKIEPFIQLGATFYWSKYEWSNTLSNITATLKKYDFAHAPSGLKIQVGLQIHCLAASSGDLLYLTGGKARSTKPHEKYQLSLSHYAQKSWVNTVEIMLENIPEIGFSAGNGAFALKIRTVSWTDLDLLPRTTGSSVEPVSQEIILTSGTVNWDAERHSLVKLELDTTSTINLTQVPVAGSIVSLKVEYFPDDFTLTWGNKFGGIVSSLVDSGLNEKRDIFIFWSDGNRLYEIHHLSELLYPDEAIEE